MVCMVCIIRSLFPCRVAGLIFVWLVAMVIGFLYKRFIVGAKGWEQVPLLSIYREFGNLEAVSILLASHSLS